MRTHTFFSTFPPDNILKRLTEGLDESGVEWKVKPPTWKINFEVHKQVNINPGEDETESDSSNSA